MCNPHQIAFSKCETKILVRQKALVQVQDDYWFWINLIKILEWLKWY